jgi:hypothetical protein
LHAERALCTFCKQGNNYPVTVWTVTSHVVLGWAESSPVESRPNLFWADFGPVSFWAGSGPFEQKFFKNYFKKYVIFCNFITVFWSISVCIFIL